MQHFRFTATSKTRDI